MELILSDKVVKHALAGNYQTWTAPIADDGACFKPFISVLSDTKAESKVDFYPDKMAIVRQTQVKNEDWQAFSIPQNEDDVAVAVAAEESSVNKDHKDQGTTDKRGADEGGADAGGANEDGTDEDGADEVMASPEISTSQTQAHEASYQQGYDQGFTLGQSEGEVKGIEAGQQQVQAFEEQRNQDIKKAVSHLNQVADTLSDELLQPMQTLAVHLAKELVRGELSLSSSTIERLIMLSMQQLQTTRSVVQVQVSSLDFERLQHHHGLPDQVVLKPSDDISLGSIKIEHAGSWVEDLIEDRLAQISQQVFGFVDDHFIDPMQMIEPAQNPEPQLQDPHSPVAQSLNEQQQAHTPEQQKKAAEDD